MSKIPYIFETPVPSFFRERGWFKTDNTLKFVTWAFARCCSFDRDICHDNKNIHLKAFQFIFGRHRCSIETNMSEDEVRTQVKSMESAGYLKKAPNKTPSRFTIYEWLTTSFSETNPQVNPQVTPKSPPSHPHNLDSQNLDIQKNNDECERRCFFQCLKEDNRLDDEDRQALMKFSEDRIELALEYSKKVKATVSLMAQLIWHCNQKKPPQIKKNFKKEVREIFKHGEKYNNTECFVNDEEISFQRGMKHFSIKNTKPEYEEEFMKILKNFDINIEKYRKKNE